MPAASRIIYLLPMCTLLGASSAWAAEEESVKVIQSGSQVSIEYTLKLDDGDVVDTNVGGEPLVYEQDRGQMLPALEQELSGMTAGDSKQVTLSAEQGYGAVNPEAYQEVPLEDIPEDAREAGARLVVQGPSGQHFAQVKEVHDESAVLDFNHPLAGQTLHFDIKVVDVK